MPTTIRMNNPQPIGFQFGQVEPIPPELEGAEAVVLWFRTNAMGDWALLNTYDSVANAKHAANCHPGGSGESHYRIEGVGVRPGLRSKPHVVRIVLGRPAAE